MYNKMLVILNLITSVAFFFVCELMGIMYVLVFTFYTKIVPLCTFFFASAGSLNGRRFSKLANLSHPNTKNTL